MHDGHAMFSSWSLLHFSSCCKYVLACPVISYLQDETMLCSCRCFHSLTWQSSCPESASCSCCCSHILEGATPSKAWTVSLWEAGPSKTVLLQQPSLQSPSKCVILEWLVLVVHCGCTMISDCHQNPEQQIWKLNQLTLLQLSLPIPRHVHNISINETTFGSQE